MRHWILASSALLAVASPALADIGRVKSATGDAYVERGGQRLTVQPGFTLQPGDTLVTGPKGKMGITFIDNTRVATGPASRMLIRTFDYNDTTYRGQIFTELSRGAVAIVAGRIAKSDPGAMRVRAGKTLYLIRGGRVIIKAAAR
jgi:hypothetical protein